MCPFRVHGVSVDGEVALARPGRLVSVVAALYPAWTVLLARLVPGVRTGRTQQAGLALAAVAVGLIATAA